MKDQLISFETAKLAKEKGFDEPVQHYWWDSNKNILYGEGIRGPLPLECRNSDSCGYYISAPTQSLLQKWLREKYNFTIVIMTSTNTNGKFEVSIEEIVKPFGTDMTDSMYCKDIEYNTYEEALEQGLIEALKLIP